MEAGRMEEIAGELAGFVDEAGYRGRAEAALREALWNHARDSPGEFPPGGPAAITSTFHAARLCFAHGQVTAPFLSIELDVHRPDLEEVGEIETFGRYRLIVDTAGELIDDYLVFDR